MAGGRLFGVNAGLAMTQAVRRGPPPPAFLDGVRDPRATRADVHAPARGWRGREERGERRTICVVTTSYPSHEGDPSGHFVETEVRELEAAGHVVEVVKPTAGGAFGWPGVASRLRERPWRIGDAGMFMARASLRVFAARPTKIIAHWAVPCGFPIVTGAAHVDAEVELVSHGADVRLLKTLPRRARVAVVDALTERASAWRFVSESLREELFSCLPERQIQRVERVSVVAPSPLEMLDVEAGARNRKQVVGARKLYVTAGRLVPSKRVDKIIDYVATREPAEPSTLIVIGDGPERATLEEVAYRWRIDARFLGTTSRRETLSWIGAADEFVHASEAEGYSTVLREAEHLGVKVTVL